MSSATAAAPTASADLEQQRRRRMARQRRILASGTDRLNRIRATFNGEEVPTGRTSRPVSGRATPASRPTTPVRGRSPVRDSDHAGEPHSASQPASRRTSFQPPALGLVNAAESQPAADAAQTPAAPAPADAGGEPLQPEPSPLTRTLSTSSASGRMHRRRESRDSVADAPISPNIPYGRGSRRPSFSDAMHEAIRSLSAHQMADNADFNQFDDNWMAGGLPPLRERRGSDASLMLMQEMANLNPLNSLLPSELANFAAGGMPPFLPAQAIETLEEKRRRRQWLILHFISVLLLAVGVASSLFGSDAAEVVQPSTGNAEAGWFSGWFSGTPLFYLFLTLEIGLQSARIMFDKRLAPRVIQLQAQTSPLSRMLALASRYKMIWSTFLFDLSVLVFTVGLAVTWSSAGSTIAAKQAAAAAAAAATGTVSDEL
ncbi:hypothetical protein THASP1DRAFT_27601 [Thamnocephalis sphaerospora]|uniref:Uncharacterized protein n=1 Tax=Thamnocephalis sphaerospora TaxID=78915 RepID=A0A4P9XWA6_9FUNG|nr:hypothetical protein THASP1DRAFT_31399 [Thamnocephalis sphaerospora]RKP10588.1 hypothetical protein THASP1DRAFT_27601 [Thamnocephalis sphaerospora]|eukprot:RKP06794.1 hypothetical protein THASP1DRAFT_31399 [Thamnocephalis sphaerospora]